MKTDDGFIYASNKSGTPQRIDTAGIGGPSTRIIKANITAVEDIKISEFLDKIEIKEFDNLLYNKKDISLIIEDEEEKNNPFSNLLFDKIEHGFIFKELPSYLKPYENNEEIIEKKGDNYYFSPKIYNMNALLSISIASNKYNYNRIKKLEEKNLILNSRVDKLGRKVETMEKTLEELLKKWET